ncbi:RedY protein [Zooshikella harenae]|uniref:RedY protein n=1 Tax=Zooshikella harenae TaxID=2827238 RepID=A0ABS5ZCI7_9GAMM|nr:RedY protein [Zooshikella harenae]MBU2711771.1 RedY protein [Zooshikella harenae]
MDTIIHKIRLLDINKATDFEHWVETTDYATCPDLPSVLQFDVHRVSQAPDASYHYVEIIKVTNHTDFNNDMSTDVFAGLVSRFTSMAEVVEEVSGIQLGLGYRATN